MATLQRYIKALGGELELVARFGDKRITIVGTTPPDTDAATAARSDRAG
jgi:hypothetical protein